MSKNSKTHAADATEQNIALYTKYRPQKFAEVLGQEHITAPISAAIKNKKIAHAYLFTGTRGTGKTSVARILAQELGVSANDVFEIDAASNNSVEDIRALNEAVNISPFDSEYKIYILDEVHMLSKSAFNALLKTLEEPPKFVIFILATTEPHKIPDTVISRCETYGFKTPNRDVLKKMIEKTAKAEGYQLDGPAADLIALLGDGSFRDCQTILQKLFRTSADTKLTVEEVEQITGAPKSNLINQVITALTTQNDDDFRAGLAAIKTARENNLDAYVFAKLLLEKYRALLLMKVMGQSNDLYDDIISAEEKEKFADLLKDHADKVNSAILNILLEATTAVRHAYLPYVPLELALIEVCGEK